MFSPFLRVLLLFSLSLSLPLLVSYADVDWTHAVGWTARLCDEIQISTLINAVGSSNTDASVRFARLLLLFNSVSSAVYAVFVHNP